ncbi:hypothetical protein [Helicobacter cetorum]|uniref:hypothetical protein n=1 Tax=Helicobacter cetorum TaxID=138563 RepID=UPI000CF167C2|nr:hypothetical protein [Helicobacter cetorum]
MPKPVYVVNDTTLLIVNIFKLSLFLMPFVFIYWIYSGITDWWHKKEFVSQVEKCLKLDYSSSLDMQNIQNRECLKALINSAIPREKLPILISPTYETYEKVKSNKVKTLHNEKGFNLFDNNLDIEILKENFKDKSQRDIALKNCMPKMQESLDKQSDYSLLKKRLQAQCVKAIWDLDKTYAPKIIALEDKQEKALELQKEKEIKHAKGLEIGACLELYDKSLSEKGNIYDALSKEDEEKCDSVLKNNQVLHYAYDKKVYDEQLSVLKNQDSKAFDNILKNCLDEFAHALKNNLDTLDKNLSNNAVCKGAFSIAKIPF